MASLPTLWIGVGLIVLLSAMLIMICVELKRCQRRLTRCEEELDVERKRAEDAQREVEQRDAEQRAAAQTAAAESNTAESQQTDEEESKQLDRSVATEIYEEYVDGSMTHSDRLFLQRLTAYIEQHLDSSELVVNSLCDFMGVTPLVLNKKLKTLVDMTANVYIRTIRLRRAAQLLRTARYTVADVTYDVGFSDLRYFRECFKKEFGVLPQEYKDQNINAIENLKSTSNQNEE